jgi:RimJ/RimL family protein N-acetyltransferase
MPERSAFSEVPVLEGRVVRLEPLAPRHAADLERAVAVGELWRKWAARIPAPDEMAADIDRRTSLAAEGLLVPWAVCLASSGEAVGMTTYLNLDEPNRRLEIGSTWLGRAVQGTGLNAEAKLLQLARAFDVLGCIAVEFRTHFHNRQSRAAIERLGAKQDGVLRSHQVWKDGTLRDTVVYSILAAEWPAVRMGLEERMRSTRPE